MVLESNLDCALIARIIRAEVGVVAELRACPDGSEWCEVIVGGRTGWLRRFEIWGVYPEEAVD